MKSSLFKDCVVYTFLQKLKNIHNIYFAQNSWMFENEKKWKDSLETRVKQAVLHGYVENQAILESILLYCASKYHSINKP